MSQKIEARHQLRIGNTPMGRIEDRLRLEERLRKVFIEAINRLKKADVATMIRMKEGDDSPKELMVEKKKKEKLLARKSA